MTQCYIAAWQSSPYDLICMTPMLHCTMAVITVRCVQHETVLLLLGRGRDQRAMFQCHGRQWCIVAL